MNERMKEQLLALAYDNQGLFSIAERDEFDCLIALIEDGTINTFEELARYGVEVDIKSESCYNTYIATRSTR